MYSLNTYNRASRRSDLIVYLLMSLTAGSVLVHAILTHAF